MFHAEAYMDKHTYLDKDHIFWCGLRQQAHICSTWCVFALLAEVHRTEFEKAFSGWFYRELALALGKGAVEIQKEIRRFGGFLENTASGYGIEGTILLCVYFQGSIYTYPEQGSAVYLFQDNRGLYLGDIADSSVRQRLQAVYEACRDDTIEKAANRLRHAMLSSVCRRELEKGYFLMWEDKDAL